MHSTHVILSARLLNAAMKRASMRPENRKPFFYYVDEFQNFTTESVEDMATEGRKFGIVLHLANQSLAQIPGRMRDTILGNVSTLLLYRLGPYDACFMEPYVVPYFNFRDLMELPNHHAIARIPAAGGISRAFCFQPAKPLPVLDEQRIAHIRRMFRTKAKDSTISVDESMQSSESHSTPRAPCIGDIQVSEPSRHG